MKYLILLVVLFMYGCMAHNGEVHNTMNHMPANNRIISLPKMPVQKPKTQQILTNDMLKPVMFTQSITGELDILLPTKTRRNSKGKIISEQYEINMVQTKQQFLPAPWFNKTTIYAYGGQTKNGYKAMFPGPAIFATKDVSVKVLWRNKIKGPHILPVDFNYPFLSTPQFKFQVPTIPHVHGLSVQTAFDGQPQAYWTSSGFRAAGYNTYQKCKPNQAVFLYPNQQPAGNNWYHDHAFGITRLNVYAGLAGFYKISDTKCRQQQKQQYLKIKYGSSVSQDQTKYLVITDKTFDKNGQLYLHEQSANQNFDQWNPQFFGNTILVNGVIWPKMDLKRGVYRFVLLNACIARGLNIRFENKNKNIPFELVRIDQDYYKQPVIVNEFFVSLSTRVEFILDLTNIQGEVMLRKDASVGHAHSMGQQQSQSQQLTDQIIKIVVKKSQLWVNEFKKPNFFHKFLNKKICDFKYPAFPQGQKVFTTLMEILNQQDQPESMFIDGTAMMDGMDCKNSTYKIGKVYDFYFINLTPDSHPIHFHLINMQKIKQFKFDAQKYQTKYYQINGGQPDKYGFKNIPPFWLNPQPYRTGRDEYPKAHQKIFADTIQMAPGYVTVVRIKFSKNDGTQWKSFDLEGQRYVFHCHVLPHQDNQMMKYFCLQ